MCDTEICCCPVVAGSGDQQIVDNAMRQAVRSAVVCKLVTIKTRDAIICAEPEKTAWIGNDLVDAVARQAIGCGVGLDRKLFGVECLEQGEDQQYRNQNP